MIRQFILDENVIILAAKQENDSGESDLTCYHLLTRILTICHPMVIDDNLRRKYFRQLSILLDTHPQISPDVIVLLRNATARPDKIPPNPNSPTFPEETNIPQGSQDDVEHVRLAVATGAILVTTDSLLISDLETAGISEQYQLQVVTPEQALPLL